MTDARQRSLSPSELEQRLLERCPHGRYAYSAFAPEGLFDYTPCPECLRKAYEHLMEKAIEQWHFSEAGQRHPIPVYDWLGITVEQYARWVERGNDYVVEIPDA